MPIMTHDMIKGIIGKKYLFFFYTKIEEIKTITTPIIATDNPPIDSLSKPSFFVLFNCSNKRHTRKMTIAIKKILLLI